MTVLLTNLHCLESMTSPPPLREKAVISLQLFTSSSCGLSVVPRGAMNLDEYGDALVQPDRKPNLSSRFRRSSAGGEKKQQQTDVTVGLQGWCEVPYLSLVFSSSNSDQREIFNSVFKS